MLAAGRSLDRLIDRDPMAAAPLVAQLLGRTFYEVDYDDVDELNEMLHRNVEPLVIAHDAEVQAAYQRALGHRARYVFRSRFPKR